MVEAANTLDWAACSLLELIAHLEQTHHQYTRDRLQSISVLTHGLRSLTRPETAELLICFDAMHEDLLQHLLKEERILFPYLVAMEADPATSPESCFGSIANPIRMMQLEHATVSHLQARIRQLAENDTCQVRADDLLAQVYRALHELDRDLMQHMKLEDEFLFPRALALEIRNLLPVRA